MNAPSPPPDVPMEILAAVQSDPEVRAELLKILKMVPRRDKCIASIGLGAAGLVVTALGALGLVTGDALTVGIGLATSAAVLIREFCWGSVP